MGISPVSFQSYIYNTNYVNAKSMDKVSQIPEDVLNSRMEYTVEDQEAASNALKPGETKGFTDILSMQLQMGMNNASRFFPAESGVESSLSVEEMAENAPDMDGYDGRTTDKLDMEEANRASAMRNVSQETAGVSTVDTVQGTGEESATLMDNRLGGKGEFNLFRTNQALDAYMSWMIA